VQPIKWIYIILCSCLPVIGWGQLQVYPLENKIEPRTPQAARMKASDPLPLPFWDDFSFTETNYPVDSLWANNRKVLVNSGQGINPPSINVATFDGFNEFGTPYTTNPNDNLDFGYRDTLESQPIKLQSEVLPGLRNTVFLSFYYQMGGYGEPPDPNDFLRVEFKATTGWEAVATLRNDQPGFDPTVFYDTLIRINADRFYHDAFQFRFISFGRRSGRYDVWHIDYVYLNKNRDENDRSRPDRATTTKLTTLFDSYYAMPIRHLENSKAITAPQFEAFNLREPPSTTTNYQITGTFTNFHGDSPTEYSTQIGPSLPGINGVTDATFPALTRMVVPLPFLPDPTDNNQFDYSSDYILVKLKIKLFADDVYDIDTGEFSEDYDPARHFPIDFRTNDTTSQTYTIKDYYAYDDGEAEQAAGLAQAGNQFAYLFEMKTTEKDTLNGVMIHYPFFAGATASNMTFYVFKNNGGIPGDILYEQLVPVVRTSNNQFITIDLFEGIEVQGSFFLGYKEPATGRVRIGLDKSNDTSHRMFFKAGSSWQEDDRISGSFMMRPRFGKADVVTGLPETQRTVSVYPNPSTGEFFLQGVAKPLQVVNLAGQPVPFHAEFYEEDKQKITLPNVRPGIYLIRYRAGAKLFSQKIIVTP
jgi:hypothetical protein